jgi:ABC-type nickel/cobalt efflux system permease component RcnA
MRASRLAGLLAVLALVAPARASAHPMGNFSISHYAAIQVEPDGVRLRYALDLAEIPTFQVLQGEGLPAEPEHPGVRAYLARTVEALADALTIELDGRRLALRSEGFELIFPPGAGGLPTLKLGVVYRAALPRSDGPATMVLAYRDGNYAERAGWKEIVATAAPGVTLVASTVPERDRSRELSDYPTDPAEAPPQTLEAQVVFARAALPTSVAALAPAMRPEGPGPPRSGASGTPAPPIPTARAKAPAEEPAPADPPGPDAGAAPVAMDTRGLTTNVRGTPRDPFTALIAGGALGPGMLLFALAVAASLGAFHALEPGHGKTVVAAYLVGSRGTAGHALLLGLVVTASHTVGVYLLGAVTLYASNYVVPERLYPWLGAASGILIVLLGLNLLWRRLRRPSAAPHPHAHDHDHVHGHYDGRSPTLPDHEEAHARGLAHGHAAGHGHHHHMPDGPVSLRALVALGVSGGIVPCPAALVVLLSAVAMGRIGLGLLLIVAFSAGLAAVLIAIGIVVVYARGLVARLGRTGVEGPLVHRWLPLTSAAVITLSGVVITVQALGG